jgi:cytosine/adenosine deaminase-related metal-dependent hydrolase
MRTRRLAARWLIPVQGPPIERGALLIGSDGRILSVGPDASVPRPVDTPAEEFDDAVILPGLINTHTHLELTGFEDRVPEREFTAWIRRLRELKATRGYAEYVEAARRGLASCFACGVTTVADTGDSGAVITALAEAGGSGIAYHEVFGPHPAQTEESLAGLQARVDELRPLATDRVSMGVSPHAPYTVSGQLFRAVSDWARSEQLPVAVHVAESPAESELLLWGAGPFAEAWRTRGIPLPSPAGRTPIRWLAEHGALSDQTLCIHAVQVDGRDIGRLEDSGAAVAHCPLSNRAHGHGEAPLEALLESGIRVGLGTDSVVSVGRLDLLAEARAAAGLAPSLAADDLIELCTLSGARALGLDSQTGSLRPGKWGDCIVVRIPTHTGGTPVEQVVASGPRDVLRTYVGGKEVYRSP